MDKVKLSLTNGKYVWIGAKDYEVDSMDALHELERVLGNIQIVLNLESSLHVDIMVLKDYYNPTMSYGDFTKSTAIWYDEIEACDSISVLVNDLKLVCGLENNLMKVTKMCPFCGKKETLDINSKLVDLLERDRNHAVLSGKVNALVSQFYFDGQCPECLMKTYHEPFPGYEEYFKEKYGTWYCACPNCDHPYVSKTPLEDKSIVRCKCCGEIIGQFIGGEVVLDPSWEED